MNIQVEIKVINGQNTINGYTLKQITSMMHRWGKLINWYNKKYNYDVPDTKSEYKMAVKTWDHLKVTRDRLKAA